MKNLKVPNTEFQSAEKLVGRIYLMSMWIVASSRIFLTAMLYVK